MGLGRTIRRHAWRHAFGRAAATAVALALGAPVYDTQCGAKLLRVTAEVPRLLATPFRTRWLFDVEALTSKNITASATNDTQPMWHGETLYFLSDRDENKRYNIWAMDTASGAARQVTRFVTMDVAFPASITCLSASSMRPHEFQ